MKSREFLGIVYDAEASVFEYLEQCCVLIRGRQTSLDGFDSLAISKVGLDCA